MNPKATWGYLVQHFEQGTVDAELKLEHEIVNIRLESFDSMELYCDRLIYLRRRLDATTDFKVTDKVLRVTT